MSEEPRSLTTGQVFMGLLAVYFGFAGLIVLDELVFDTFYLASHSPDWLGPIMQVVYWPLIWIVSFCLRW